MAENLNLPENPYAGSEWEMGFTDNDRQVNWDFSRLKEVPFAGNTLESSDATAEERQTLHDFAESLDAEARAKDEAKSQPETPESPEPETTETTTFPELDHAAEKTFARLDSPEFREKYGVVSTDIANIASVFAGLKEGAQIELPSDYWLDQGIIGGMLERLGLKYEYEVVDGGFGIPGYESTLFYISKDPDTAKKIPQLFVESRAEKQAGDATRELGRIFGYPATATEYYIDHNKTAYQTPPHNSGYSFFVHSPEHAEEEFEQYDRRFYEIAKHYCPNAAADMLANPDYRGLAAKLGAAA